MLGAAVKGQQVITTTRSAPYGSVEISCARLPNGIKMRGFITHKLDFLNVWQAFAEEDVKLGRREVLAYWTKRHYANVVARLLSHSMPKFLVMTCRPGTFESCKNGLDWPAKEEAIVLVHALESTKWWKPEPMT